MPQGSSISPLLANPATAIIQHYGMFLHYDSEFRFGGPSARTAADTGHQRAGGLRRFGLQDHGANPAARFRGDATVVARGCAARQVCDGLAHIGPSRPAPAGLLLGYGAIPTSHIEEGM